VQVACQINWLVDKQEQQATWSCTLAECKANRLNKAAMLQTKKSTPLTAHCNVSFRHNISLEQKCRQGRGAWEEGGTAASHQTTQREDLRGRLAS